MVLIPNYIYLEYLPPELKELLLVLNRENVFSCKQYGPNTNFIWIDVMKKSLRNIAHIFDKLFYINASKSTDLKGWKSI
jgi:hypothetical protein